MVYSERQSWLDLVSSSATEEGDQPLTFCVQIHSDEPPEVVCGDAAEGQEVRLSEPNGGSQTSYLSADTHFLAVPDAAGQRSLAKGELMRGEIFAAEPYNIRVMGFLNFFSPSFLCILH